MFKPVSPKVDFPKQEEEMLRFWKKNKIFEKSIESRSPDKKWTFLDGPPFITGLPHYGSLLVSIPKDVFPRFWTMKGYRVRRVWGWDVHGLPAENKVETKLGLKSKREIEEKVGIKKFIEECRKYVSESSKEWEWYIDRVARWVDFKNAYKTMDLSYMETVMWVFKQIYDKGLIYKGLRVSLYCPHCATPISNFEVAMDPDNYKKVASLATTYKYKVLGEEDTYFLAWSTTPWNKIVTPALAVNPKLAYVKIVQGSEKYILAKATLKILKEEKYKIVEEFRGEELIGKKFEPHYDFYSIDSGKNAFEIVGGDFVTAEEGTGIVTIAAYGEEDLKLMQKENIQIVMHVDEEGTIKNDVPKFGGMYYLKADKAVNEDLRSRGLIYREDNYSHSVAHCWRCQTRLYYAPQNAWYINVQTLKPRLKKNNEVVNWSPKHFKYGRFLKSMEAAPDWCISRSRYWGSPVPVWECVCGQRYVPGSIKELEKLSGKTIKDLHKPDIDEVVILCKKCGQFAKRVPEVLDSWIEAGSASFAERHFPFDPTTASEQEKLEDFFPPDFIVEYTGQIRAWFYVLHVIATALFDSNAFKNVVVTGVILGTDGRKMSKNFGNYPDPKEMLLKYGGDALRLYLMGSPVMHGEDILISEERYREQVKGTMLILWNTYNFFVTYANVDQWNIKDHPFGKLRTRISNIKNQNVLDTWILSLLNRLIKDVTESLEGYDTVKVTELLGVFIDNFSKWYIRRSRDRVGTSASDQKHKEAFYQTCYEVLIVLCKLLAPITPFLSEAIYKNLTTDESVHLVSWPIHDRSLINSQIEEQMMQARKVVEIAHAKRKEAGIKVRQPLSELLITLPAVLLDGILDTVKKEVNVKEIKQKKGKEIGVMLDITITPALKKEGDARDIVRQIQQERKKLGSALDEKVNVMLPDWPLEFEDTIKKEALVETLSKGDTFRVQSA